ncbi:hypothetical protein [Rhodococcus sp. NPDC058521]|uniref:hypothetical protein n=1 Tax=Rhodococcus sp. NPDC058521 TaxID=3346536 RepID=UPI003656A5B9
MADNKTRHEADDSNDNVRADGTSGDRRRPSVLLILSGIVALIISAWALAGPFGLTPLGADAVRWIFVGGAVVIGAVLVLSPNWRKKKQD